MLCSIMSNAIREKLEDLNRQAEENCCFSSKACGILKRYMEMGKNTLDEINDGRDFFTTIAFLNAQKKSPKIEQFIRKKLQHNPVNSKIGQGDGEKKGIYYEYKISTTNKKEKINALQIRLWQEIDYYLLGYIDEIKLENSRLYLVPKKEMEELCNQYGTATHGTEDANDSNKNIEMSLRIEMKTENGLLALFEKKYRSIDFENQIFN